MATSTLRFYEKEGLISSRRTAGNQRRYHRDVLRRVAFIRVAQRVGISLAMIREALAVLPGERTPNRADWAALSASWETELSTRILLLQQLKDSLTGCIGCGCLSLDRCPLANPGDILGTAGPGPRAIREAVPDPAGDAQPR
ncbi:redox-sensitive transcriptional activator SoxR [Actinocorallia lasiicapitis]